MEYNNNTTKTTTLKKKKQLVSSLFGADRQATTPSLANESFHLECEVNWVECVEGTVNNNNNNKKNISRARDTDSNTNIDIGVRHPYEKFVNLMINDLHLFKDHLSQKLWRSAERNYAAYENVCKVCGYGVFNANGKLCNFCEIFVNGGVSSKTATTSPQTNSSHIYENICEKCTRIYSSDECECQTNDADKVVVVVVTTTDDGQTNELHGAQVQNGENTTKSEKVKKKKLKLGKSKSFNRHDPPKRNFLYGLFGSFKRVGHSLGSSVNFGEKSKSSQSSQSPQRPVIVHHVDGFENVFRTQETFDLQRICELKRSEPTTTTSRSEEHIYGRLKASTLAAACSVGSVRSIVTTSNDCNSTYTLNTPLTQSYEALLEDDDDNDNDGESVVVIDSGGSCSGGGGRGGWCSASADALNSNISVNSSRLVSKSGKKPRISRPRLLRLKSAASAIASTTLSTTTTLNTHQHNRSQSQSQSQSQSHLSKSVWYWLGVLRRDVHDYQSEENHVNACTPKSIPSKNEPTFLLRNVSHNIIGLDDILDSALDIPNVLHVPDIPDSAPTLVTNCENIKNSDLVIELANDDQTPASRNDSDSMTSRRFHFHSPNTLAPSTVDRMVDEFKLGLMAQKLRESDAIYRHNNYTNNNSHQHHQQCEHQCDPQQEHGNVNDLDDAERREPSLNNISVEEHRLRRQGIYLKVHNADNNNANDQNNEDNEDKSTHQQTITQVHRYSSDLCEKEIINIVKENSQQNNNNNNNDSKNDPIASSHVIIFDNDNNNKNENNHNNNNKNNNSNSNSKIIIKPRKERIEGKRISNNCCSGIEGETTTITTPTTATTTTITTPTTTLRRSSSLTNSLADDSPTSIRCGARQAFTSSSKRRGIYRRDSDFDNEILNVFKTLTQRDNNNLNKQSNIKLIKATTTTIATFNKESQEQENLSIEKSQNPTEINHQQQNVDHCSIESPTTIDDKPSSASTIVDGLNVTNQKDNNKLLATTIITITATKSTSNDPPTNDIEPSPVGLIACNSGVAVANVISLGHALEQQITTTTTTTPAATTTICQQSTICGPSTNYPLRNQAIVGSNGGSVDDFDDDDDADDNDDDVVVVEESSDGQKIILKKGYLKVSKSRSSEKLFNIPEIVNNLALATSLNRIVIFYEKPLIAFLNRFGNSQRFGRQSVSSDRLIGKFQQFYSNFEQLQAIDRRRKFHIASNVPKIGRELENHCDRDRVGLCIENIENLKSVISDKDVNGIDQLELINKSIDFVECCPKDEEVNIFMASDRDRSQVFEIASRGDLITSKSVEKLNNNIKRNPFYKNNNNPTATTIGGGNCGCDGVVDTSKPLTKPQVPVRNPKTILTTINSRPLKRAPPIPNKRQLQRNQQQQQQHHQQLQQQQQQQQPSIEVLKNSNNSTNDIPRAAMTVTSLNSTNISTKTKQQQQQQAIGEGALGVGVGAGGVGEIKNPSTTKTHQPHCQSIVNMMLGVSSTETEAIYQPIWQFQTVGEVQERYQTDADYYEIGNAMCSSIADANFELIKAQFGEDSSLPPSLLNSNNVEDDGEWETDDEFMFTVPLGSGRAASTGISSDSCSMDTYSLNSSTIQSSNSSKSGIGSGSGSGSGSRSGLRVRFNASNSGSTIAGFDSSSNSSSTTATLPCEIGSSLRHSVFRNIGIFYSLTDPSLRTIVYDYDRAYASTYFTAKRINPDNAIVANSGEPPSTSSSTSSSPIIIQSGGNGSVRSRGSGGSGSGSGSGSGRYFIEEHSNDSGIGRSPNQRSPMPPPRTTSIATQSIKQCNDGGNGGVNNGNSGESDKAVGYGNGHACDGHGTTVDAAVAIGNDVGGVGVGVGVGVVVGDGDGISVKSNNNGIEPLPYSVQAWKFLLLDVNYIEDEEDMIVHERDLWPKREQIIEPQECNFQRFKSTSVGSLEIPEDDKKSIAERVLHKLNRGVLRFAPRSPKLEKKTRGFFRKAGADTSSLCCDEGIKPKYPIFGATLDQLELNATAHPDVPQFVVDCVAYIERKESINQDGLYRASGNKVSIDELKHKLSESYIYDSRMLIADDIHTVTSLLKLFFRELPTPLIPQDLYERLGGKVSDAAKIKEMCIAFDNIRDPNLSTLKFIIRHLTNVASCSKDNRMPASNLAIVWGPCLFSGNHIEFDIARMNTLAKLLIENYNTIFNENERLVS